MKVPFVLAVVAAASGSGRDFVTSYAKPGRMLNPGIWSHHVTGQKTLTEGRTVRP